MRQTLRRLRGRQPLWACGVTSRMPVTSRPAAWSERIAVSRPEPGPFTKTSTFSRPCSMPLRAAESAVTWAANGVDLREPLKPAPPADSHAITFPSLSVRETIVLLKLVLMWAWPNGMFLRGLRRPRPRAPRSEEHTSELQSRQYLVCRLLLEKKTIFASLFIISIRSFLLLSPLFLPLLYLSNPSLSIFLFLYAFILPNNFHPFISQPHSLLPS